MDKWIKKPIEWIDGNCFYVSVVFTWQLPQVYSRCVWARQQGHTPIVGGTAIRLMPDYLKQVALIGEDIDVLSKHNKDATFTTRGCPNRCKFCAVPITEGEFRELDTWQPKSIICDNNFLASSRKHFDKVIDSLKPLSQVDFNQGLDARLLKPYHLNRLRELGLKYIRFAWDNINSETQVMDAIHQALSAGIPKSKIRVYILVNFTDDFNDAMYRCVKLKEIGVFPFVQRYQPLDTLVKNSYVSQKWSKQQLIDFCRYWNKQTWLKKIPFDEYKRHKRTTKYCSQVIPMELR